MVIGVLLVFCTACADNGSPYANPSTVTPSPSVSEPDKSTDCNDILPSPNAEVLEFGKKLLEEYDVKYNQSIRFPYEGLVYESRGAYALTTIEEVRGKYPDFTIPAKLGEYQFGDLTIDNERTSNVFPDMIPRPKDTIEVLTNHKTPVLYYLCYTDNAIHFRIQVWPVYLEDVREVFEELVLEYATWSLHSDVYVGESLDDPQKLPYLLISSGDDGKYAFFVQKLSTSDCLESDTIDFSEQEALQVYTAIRNDFHA